MLEKLERNIAMCYNLLQYFYYNRQQHSLSAAPEQAVGPMQLIHMRRRMFIFFVILSNTRFRAFFSLLLLLFVGLDVAAGDADVARVDTSSEPETASVTRHTSHVTRHMSRVTRHALHVTSSCTSSLRTTLVCLQC